MKLALSTSSSPLPALAPKLVQIIGTFHMRMRRLPTRARMDLALVDLLTSWLCLPRAVHPVLKPGDIIWHRLHMRGEVPRRGWEVFTKVFTKVLMIGRV
jgi:hypothetical protein